LRDHGLVVESSPIRIFISYAHADEAHRARLEAHLTPLQRNGLVSVWHDRMIEPGTEWSTEIDRNLAVADVVLLLVSADFVASDYCYQKEMQLALERHDRGEACVIPILVGPVDYARTPIAKLQALPADAKPVSRWSDPNEAWLNVVQAIGRRLAGHPYSAAGHAGPRHGPGGCGAAQKLPGPTLAEVRVRLFNLATTMEWTLIVAPSATLLQVVREFRAVISSHPWQAPRGVPKPGVGYEFGIYRTERDGEPLAWNVRVGDLIGDFAELSLNVGWSRTVRGVAPSNTR
jgi:hypothetical protein